MRGRGQTLEGRLKREAKPGFGSLEDELGSGDMIFSGVTSTERRCEDRYREPQFLTIEFSVPGSQCVNQERAVLLHQASEGGLGLPSQPLFYLTGTAGVLLGTDTKVLT